MPGSKRITRDLNWNEYDKLFPKRYLEGGYSPLIGFSDRTMKEALSNRPPGRAIDVGGGIYGTSYLIEWADDYVLLDPNVKSDLLHITWEDVYRSLKHEQLFDVVLARGSINYLGHAGQIPTLCSAVAKGGLFIFNTFIHPPSDKMERRYVSKTGWGIERAELVYGGPFGMVEHELVPEDEEYRIFHQFHYYPISFLKEILEPVFDCKVVKDNNSAVFICEKL